MKENERKKKENKSIDEPPIITHNQYHQTCYCPICDRRFPTSEYLGKVFKDDEKTMWLANMVMHYPHNHITSWNKYWGYRGWAYRNAAHFGDYDEEKAKVNERAKRQIARKCTKYIIDNDINYDVFNKLQGTTEETLKVVEKIFARVREAKEKEQKEKNA